VVGHVRESPGSADSSSRVSALVGAPFASATGWADSSCELGRSQAPMLRPGERQQLQDQLIQELERKRIAAELHDSLGQSLTAIKFCVEDTQVLLGKGRVTEARARLDGLASKIREAADEVRRIAAGLRPAMLDDLGVLATIAWFLREYQTFHTSISVRQQMRLQENEIPQHVKTPIFRILQEAMNNVAKHAQADIVRLLLEKQGDNIVLSIEDNGVGFDHRDNQPQDRRKTTFGLSNICQRAVLSGGYTLVSSTRGQGTTVHAVWPTES
jgi:signal transduction histidine kinase